MVQQEGLVERNQLAGMKERSYSIISFEKIDSLLKVCSPAIQLEGTAVEGGFYITYYTHPWS